MSRYEFTSNLETGNKIIDSEHRELFQAINRLLEACDDKNGRGHMSETVKFLNDYVDRHFLHEEQLQQKSNYPGYAAHKAFHDKYKKTLKEMTLAIPPTGPSIAELIKLNGHIGVLVTHISTEDKKLADFLKK